MHSNLFFEKVNGKNIFCKLYLVPKSKKLVIIVHGFRSTHLGPNRIFHSVQEELAKNNISSISFDQCGCGDSDGESIDSSFNYWIKTIEYFIDKYSKEYSISLWGNSIGSTAALCAGLENKKVSSIVSWVPDLKTSKFTFKPEDTLEEKGQLVKGSFWYEVQYSNLVKKLTSSKVPTLVILGKSDKIIDKNTFSFFENKSNHNSTVIIYDSLEHSSWPFKVSQEIISNSLSFIINN